MKFYHLFFLVLCIASCTAPTPKETEEKTPKKMLKEVCITVDDLPVVGYSISDNAHLLNITNKLINTYKQFNIPAIGYVNEKKLYVDGELDTARLNLLDLWLANGYDLGNHTYSHMSFHDVTVDEYTQDILKGEKETKQLLQKHGKTMKYFRHPYLRIGATKAHHDSLVSFLTDHNYVESPVTIDNEDYLFALAYHKAFVKNKKEDMDKIGMLYIHYMEQKLLFYEMLSLRLFGRNIKHTLLIHASLLNADYLDDLARMYQKRGYTFISQEQVLLDEAYQTEITKYGNWGISWIDRWAMSKGKKGDFFQGDPQTPPFVKKYDN